MVRASTVTEHEKASTVAVLFAEWVRFGAGGAVMLVVNVAAAVCAAVYGPVAAAAGAVWRDTRISAGTEDVPGPFAVDAFNEILFAAAGVFAAVPAPVLAAVLGFGVFWEGRHVAFGVLRHLIARGPRWERIVTGLGCEYHSDDPAVQRRACILYGYSPYPSGLFGVAAGSFAARRDTD